MHETLQAARRLLSIAALGAIVALVAAAGATAYPITPEGDNLYADAGPTPSTVYEPGQTTAVESRTPSSSGANAIPIAEATSGGADGRAVIVVALAVVVLMALGGLGAAFVVNSHRRGSARAH